MIHYIQNCIKTHYLLRFNFYIIPPKFANLHSAHVIVQFKLIIQRNSHWINHNVLRNLIVLKIRHHLFDFCNTRLNRPRKESEWDFCLIDSFIWWEHIARLIFFNFLTNIPISDLHFSCSADHLFFDLILDPLFVIFKHSTNRHLSFKWFSRCRLVGIETRFIWDIFYLEADSMGCNLFNFLFHLY